MEGIFFLGTPHRGSCYSYMAETARRIASAVGFDTSGHTVRALNFGSAEFEVTHEAFMKQWKDKGFAVRTFYEARGMIGIRGLNEKVSHHA